LYTVSLGRSVVPDRLRRIRLFLFNL